MLNHNNIITLCEYQSKYLKKKEWIVWHYYKSALVIFYIVVVSVL